MNCKPGDLAIVVKSVAGNEGRVVRCIRLLAREYLFRGPDGSQGIDAQWEIDRPLCCWDGQVLYSCNDSALRPLRDPGDDAIDETLEWLPVPGKAVTA